MKQKSAITSLIFLFAFLLAACNGATAVTPTATAGTVESPAVTLPPPGTPASAGVTPTLNATKAADESAIATKYPKISGASQAAASRTPIPTPTPGFIDRKINKVTAGTPLAGASFLGLTIDDWANIVVSALIVLLGYILGGKLLKVALRWLTRRTDMKVDEKLLHGIGRDLQLLVVIIFTRFAVMRLEFITGGLRTLLDDIFFVLLLVMGTIIALRLVNFAVTSYKERFTDAAQKASLDAVMTATRRLGDFFVYVVAVSIGLDHFGINVSPISALLLVIGVIVALGAKDVVSDVISGFIILVDQPYRVGDVVQIQDLDTTGTVESIGTRSTYIRTSADREVIIPNSKIGESMVVNYSFPYPHYRSEIKIDVAYGSDTAQVQQIITKAVRSVKGVLAKKPVNVIFMEFGGAGKTMRVRWWISSYGEKNSILGEVNSAIEAALAEAGITMPNTTYDLNVNMEGEETDQKKEKQPDTSAKGSGNSA